MLKSLLGAAALCAVCATQAFALDVTKTASVAAAPADVWKVIGGFCGIADWHPAIENCVLSKQSGKQIRTLTLKGGGTLVEKLLARSDTQMRYSYAILEGPLPVADYKSTIKVVADSGGSKITWTGHFSAKGAPDAKAEDVIGGIYDAGLQGIASKAKP